MNVSVGDRVWVRSGSTMISGTIKSIDYSVAEVVVIDEYNNPIISKMYNITKRKHLTTAQKLASMVECSVCLN